MSLRVATFNIENLTERFSFPNHKYWATTVTKVPIELAPFERFETKRRLAAQALAQCNADIICLQEVVRGLAFGDEKVAPLALPNCELTPESILPPAEMMADEPAEDSPEEASI